MQGEERKKEVGRGLVSPIPSRNSWCNLKTNNSARMTGNCVRTNDFPNAKPTLYQLCYGCLMWNTSFWIEEKEESSMIGFSLTIVNCFPVI